MKNLFVVTDLRGGECFIHRQALGGDDHDHDPGDHVGVCATWRVARRFHRLPKQWLYPSPFGSAY